MTENYICPPFFENIKFYVDPSLGAIKILVESNINKHPDLDIKQHRSIMQHDSFEYTVYARFNKKKVGTFDLYNYSGTYDGQTAYSFYVEKPVLKKMSRRRKKKMDKRIRKSNGRFKIACI